MIPNYDFLKQQINETLSFILSQYPTQDAALSEALSYGVMLGGKRLRPLLTVLSAEAFQVSRALALKVGAAIELCHCYSLVHDDLPGLDNSPLRRGNPSCWKKYGESTAILVGDALIPMAFDLLSTLEKSCPASLCLGLIQGLSQAIGPQGMVGGQKMDMDPHDTWTLETITTMQILKTGALISFSCEAGAILGNQPPLIRQALKNYGVKLGLLYQITDDLLDYKSTPIELGKPVHQDDNKRTLVSYLGQERSYNYSEKLSQEAAECLDALPFSKRTPFLELLTYALNRVC